MFSIFFSEILLKYLNLSWSFLRRSLTFGSVYHLLVFKPKNVVYHHFHKFNLTIFWNHVEIEKSFDLTKREFISMERVLTTAASCSPPTPIPPKRLTKFGESETATEIFPHSMPSSFHLAFYFWGPNFLSSLQCKIERKCYFCKPWVESNTNNGFTTSDIELRDFSKS